MARKNATPILEQYRSRLCNLSGEAMVCLVIKCSVALLGRMPHKIQHTVHRPFNNSL